MEIRPITKQNRFEVNNFIREHWFTTEMAVRGELVDMTGLDGFVAYENARMIGLITYRLDGKDCEIMSLDSLKEKRGIGSALMAMVIRTARELHCEKVKLITTNDNLNAMRFYQKRGFDMARLYRNALESARKLKPEIPLIGDHGIPLRHEIEFEYLLSPQKEQIGIHLPSAERKDAVFAVELQNRHFETEGKS
ncbi:GNAT family N-acetyltransferase [Caproiciproducens sp. LBM24188]